jgi:hypothetical protein
MTREQAANFSSDGRFGTRFHRKQRENHPELHKGHVPWDCLFSVFFFLINESNRPILPGIQKEIPLKLPPEVLPAPDVAGYDWGPFQ